MARKVIIEELNTVSSRTLFGIAALILALGIAFYFERQARPTETHSELVRFEPQESESNAVALVAGKQQARFTGALIPEQGKPGTAGEAEDRRTFS